MSNDTVTNISPTPPLPDGPPQWTDPGPHAALERAEISVAATRGAISVMARGFGVRIIGMLGNIVLARMLLPRDFGMISLGNTIVTFGAFLASGGLARR